MDQPGFGARLALAFGLFFKLLFDAALAARVKQALEPGKPEPLPGPPKPAAKPEPEAKPSPPPAADDPDLEDKATRAYAAIPAELLPENTEDISLTDLEVSGEIVDETPAAPPSPPKAPPAPAKPKAGLPSVKKPPPPGGARRPK